MQAIQTENLTKRYGKAHGIEALTLSVAQGEFFGFIGPNGAGKSTTIRTLLGLIRPTSGSAQVLGRSVTGDRRALLDEVGYLPSETAYDAGMRVRDVLRYSASLRRRDCRAQASRLCEQLELDPARRVDELSLGNRKKVGIVCALQHDPRLLILDEPTSGLDPLMQRTFFALLEERSAQGATVFLSSHVLSEIQRHCTRAAMIREGRLLACDRVETLLGANARRVTLRGAADPGALPGVRGLRRTDEGMSFLYSGEMRELIDALSGQPVDDLTIAEPDLEEVFLHDYAKGGDAHDGHEA